MWYGTASGVVGVTWAKAVDQLAEAAGEAFCQHPDHAIITSVPGCRM